MISQTVILPISFDAKMWLQGNSLLVTIPTHFRESFNLRSGDFLQIAARKITKEELEHEKKLRQIMGSYPIEVSGSIIHKGIEIAKIGKGFVRESVIRAMTSIAGDPVSPDDWITTKIIHGAIVSGAILPSLAEEKNFGVYLKAGAKKIHRDWLYDIEMKLKTTEGKTLKIKNVRFDEDIPFIGNTGIIHFRGDL